jgi:hypothetical protein
MLITVYQESSCLIHNINRENMIRQTSLTLILAGFCAVQGLYSFSQNIIVTECMPGDFVITTVGTPNPAFAFIEENSTPLPDGCLKLTIPAFTNPLVHTFIRCRNMRFGETLLSSLTELSYCTKIISHKMGGNEAPYIRLDVSVDRNNDGKIDTVPLLFNPKYQAGATVSLNKWECWDAFKGLWWEGPEPEPGAGGVLRSLDDFIKLYNNAKIVNPRQQQTGNVVGGVSLQIGASNNAVASWESFEGCIDKFTIGVSGQSIVYDFETSMHNAGEDITECWKYVGRIGRSAIDGHTYEWSSDPAGFTSNEANPKVTVNTTTVFTLKERINATGCEMTDNIKVTILKNPISCLPYIPRIYQIIFVIIICGLIFWGIRWLKRK